MLYQTMSVKERVNALKTLFNDFGIPVMPNSALEQAISAEFGKGKRSKITPLLLELHQQSDASKLAASIGTALKDGSSDKQVVAVANVLQDRLPALLGIVDARQSTQKRIKLLSELLDHFTAKLPNTPQSERMLRMLAAAKQNLVTTMQVAAVGQVTEQIGVACKVRDLRRMGRVLQKVTPALIALDLPDYPIEMKVNHCVHGLRMLAVELRATKLVTCADILEEVHWLAKVSLPQIKDNATVEQALNALDISVGSMSIQMLYGKAQQMGLKEREIMQMLYALAPNNVLSAKDQELLDHTHENQQYAAVCGLMAKLARDLKQPELEKLGIAGICLASMRQTFFEIKTNNLNPANFSESLGTILLSAGCITGNNILASVGNSILSGVKTYAGVAAIPGGAALAVPLAVCSVLGKLFLGAPGEAGNDAPDQSAALNNLVNQVLALQYQMRDEVAILYKGLNAMHQEMLAAMDQGFANLASIVRYNNAQVLNAIRDVDQRMQDLQLQINQEFTDLYLEYIHDPLDQVAFFAKYNSIEPAALQKTKHKLEMWLLYKSKHPKITGGSLDVEKLPQICVKQQQNDGVLSLVNRYVNLKFKQHLPEDLPHIPTWLLAAHALVAIGQQGGISDQQQQERILNDIIAEGGKTLAFVQTLASNKELWECMQQEIQQCTAIIQSRWSWLKLQTDPVFLQSLSKISNVQSANIPCIAQPAANDVQLEPFSTHGADITDLWNNYLRTHVPAECLVAAKHGLGELQIKFAVDRQVNSFVDLHIPYGHNLLPNNARDVLFKIEVFFKLRADEQAHLISTAWFGYDLCDAHQRFEQYYMQKFRGLRHKRYLWLDVHGNAVHVEGHNNSVTKKAIDHERLAAVYHTWLSKSQPINAPEIYERIKQNPKFMQTQGELVARGEYAEIYPDQIMFLQLLLYNELRNEMIKQRQMFANALQQDTALNTALQRIEVCFAIVAVYFRILNLNNPMRKIIPKYNELLAALQQPQALQIDLLAELENLFLLPELIVNPGEQYLQGEFYLKMQAALARVGLLKANAMFERLEI